MGTIADRPMTVVLSSHLIADIERVCDHLIVLAQRQVRLSGHVDDLLASHKVLTGPRRDLRSMPGGLPLGDPPSDVSGARRGARRDRTARSRCRTRFVNRALREPDRPPAACAHQGDGGSSAWWG
jgi:ABC-type multidrug transport system ATPase subunit